VPTEYFSDPSRLWSHQDYPLMIPLLETWVYQWIGDCNQTFAKVPFPLFYVAAAALLISATFRLTGKAWPGALAAMLIGFVPSLTLEPGGAASGWGDFPLSVIYLTAVIYLLDFLKTRSHESLRIFTFASALLPWVKNEGSILWVTLFIALAVMAWARQCRLQFLRACLCSLIVVVAWKGFVAAVHAPKLKDFVPITMEALAANFDRIAVLALSVPQQIIDVDRWSLLWPVTLAALLVLARRKRNADALLLAWCIGFPIAAFSSVYLFSSWPDYRFHFATSFPRLLVDVALVSLLIVGLMFSEVLPQKATPSENA